MTTMEKRSLQFCNDIEAQGSMAFAIKWSKANGASIYYHGEKIAHAGGGGYCKTSAVLAQALRWLGTGIIATSGCGEQAVREACKKYGWTLGKNNDIYTITKKG